MIRFFMLMTLTAALAIGAEGDKKPAESEGDTVQTPFGPAKRQTEAPQPPPPASTAKPLVDVKLVGDTYTFSRKTPFGSQSWKRGKAELSSDEKKLVEAHEAWAEKQAEKAKPEPADKPQS